MGSISIKAINTFFFLGLIFLFFFYGVERSILYDGSSATLYVFLGDSFFYSENRFFTIITCILPILVNKIYHNIHWIVWAYAISYCILPVFNFVFFRCIVKEEKYLFLFLLSQCAFFLHGFFVASHDVIVVSYLIFIFYYFITNQDKYRASYIIVFILLFFIIFGHISHCISICLILGYLLLSSRLQPKNLALWILTIIFFLSIKLFFFKGTYETDYLIDLKASNYAILNPVLKGFYYSLFTYNLSYLVLLGATLFILLKKKKYVLAIYLVVTNITVVFFLGFIFGDTKGFHFYNEPHFKSIFILISIIFVEEIWNQKLNKIYEKAIGLMFVFTLLTIAITGNSYKKYYNYLSYTTAQIKQNTVYISKDPLFNEIYLFLPLESTIVNLLEHNSCKYILFKNQEYNDNVVKFYNYEKDILCFSDRSVVKDAPIDMKDSLQLKFKYFYINGF